MRHVRPHAARLRLHQPRDRASCRLVHGGRGLPAGARRAAVHHSRDVHHRAAHRALRLRAQGPLPLRLQDQGAAAKTEDHKSRLEYPRAHLCLCPLHHLHDPRGDDRHFLIPDLRRHPHEEARPFQLDAHQLLRHAGLSVPHLARHLQGAQGLHLRSIRQRGDARRHQDELRALHPRRGARVPDRRDRLQLHLQKPQQEVRRGAGILPAFPVAAADHSHLLFLPHLLQRREHLVRRQCEPLLRRARPHPARAGLHGGQAAVLAAHDQGGVLRHRRGAGGRRAQHGRERPDDLPQGQAAHHPTERAGGVRTELQRALYRVRYVRHLCQLLRHELRHGHSGHVRGGGTVRLQRQRLGPPLRFDRVHHAGVRRDPLSGLRRGRARSR